MIIPWPLQLGGHLSVPICNFHVKEMAFSHCTVGDFQGC